jgi:hypothetical protein
MSPKYLTALFLEEGESWNALLRRVRDTQGEVLVVFSAVADAALAAGPEQGKAFLSSIAKLSGRVRLATRDKAVAAQARSRGIRVIDRLQDLRSLLEGHAQFSDAVREFSPQLWRQQLRSRLQAMGLLSIPKLRIWILVGMSVILFGFVFLRLLPSSTITVTPREDILSQTSNIFLVQTGALLDIPERVRTVELKPITVQIDRTITFDHISKEFEGTSARMPMKIVNKMAEQYSLRKGSRLTNQAGMVFRLEDSVFVDPGQEVEVTAIADDVDLYGEVLGERGNVPEGLQWQFPGLGETERHLVYGVNTKAGEGGQTSFRTILRQKDLDVAEKQLRSELVALASQMVDEEILLYNQEHPSEVLTRLYYDELTTYAFTGFVIPTQFIGEEVASIPVQGSVVYTAYGYDAQYILSLLRDELMSHIETGKRLLPETIRMDRLVVHVIDYSDDLSWIKLTVDLSGTQQAVLDPLTPPGAKFAKEVRQAVLGKSIDEAQRIVRNFPQVERAGVSVWPPWNRVLPTIPYHITIRIGDR